MMWGWGPEAMMGGWWGFGGVIIGLIFWIIFTIVIIAIVRTLAGSSRWHGINHHVMDEDSAVRILKERYAKGEIDKAEYDAKMKDLTAK